jgi:hypothetical protein
VFSEYVDRMKKCRTGEVPYLHSPLLQSIKKVVNVLSVLERVISQTRFDKQVVPAVCEPNTNVIATVVTQIREVRIPRCLRQIDGEACAVHQIDRTKVSTARIDQEVSMSP